MDGILSLHHGFMLILTGYFRYTRTAAAIELFECFYPPDPGNRTNNATLLTIYF